MEPWFLREPARLRTERERVDEISRQADWLSGYEWRFDGGELCLDATIEAHGHNYEVRVSFPPLFPDAPAIVRPRNATDRLSSHQYGGADGPLCLQWGPDNWHRDVTAADMLVSAFRLFDIENPLGRSDTDPVIVAPSRHRLTVGQELRGAYARWYCSAGFRSFITQQDRHATGSYKFSFRSVGDREWIVLIHEAAALTGSSWSDPAIPTDFPEARSNDQYSGVWFRTDLAADDIDRADALDEIRRLVPVGVDPSFLATDGTSPVEGMERWLIGVVVSDRDDTQHAFVVVSGQTVIRCARVVSGEDRTAARRPDEDRLRGKRFGIVGVGSIGSKVALALARMGGRDFYLVDHDVLLPENLERNALDWQGVVRHKVHATKTALQLVAPSATVAVSTTHLTGQESNAAISRVVSKLSDCDIIIDATANPRVFNLLAAVARASNRSLVWVEVFGGGVGGLLARSRTGVDPSPQRMRLAYLQYCVDNPVPQSMQSPDNYEVEEPTGEVLVASDADVGILANHAARLMGDCLFPPEESKYSYSMYLLGLTAQWVFRQALETIPIDLHELGVNSEEPEAGKLHPDDGQFLVALLKKSAP